jgi:hypothetical protein
LYVNGAAGGVKPLAVCSILSLIIKDFFVRFHGKLGMQKALLALALTSLIMGAVPALAEDIVCPPQHRAVHHRKSTARHASAPSAHSSSTVRTAQRQLAELGYYDGPIDGVMGPKTAAAIRRFQGDHSLPVTGTLTRATLKALSKLAAGGGRSMSEAEPEGVPAQDYLVRHPEASEVNQDYADPLAQGSPAAIPSRFGRLEIGENGSNASGKNYVISLNGQPIIQTDGQSSVIGVSRTFDLGYADAIIFTSYRANDYICSYRHQLLILSTNQPQLLDIANCTRGFQARVDNGSLFITYPEPDDNRAIGATWRYDNGVLNKL